jgi:hypothetical protein
MRRYPSTVIRRWRPFVVLLAVLLVAACGSSSASPSTGTATPSLTAATATEPDTTGAPPASGQSDTEWGPIWDTVPSGFPTYPGSKAADVGTDPASEVRVIDGVEPTAIASWMDQHLQAAAFRTEGLSGPFEDGSYVIDASGQSGCRLQVRVAPTGGTATITVLYGASCPHG